MSGGEEEEATPGVCARAFLPGKTLEGVATASQ